MIKHQLFHCPCKLINYSDKLAPLLLLLFIYEKISLDKIVYTLMMSSPIFFDKKIHGCRDFLPIHRISQLFDVILRITTLAM